MPRIHITGASGSGTTTLGAALAKTLALPHEDSDQTYWFQTDPPYTTPRPPAERVALLLPRLTETPHWVLSGASIGWGAAFDPLYTHIIFLTLPHDLRMARLRARETTRHGARIAPGGDMHAGSVEFLEWAERYDTAGLEQRSRLQHETWLAERTCPILRLESTQPIDALVASVVAWLESK